MPDFYVHDEGRLHYSAQSERQIAPYRVEIANIPITSFQNCIQYSTSNRACQHSRLEPYHSAALPRISSASRRMARIFAASTLQTCRS